jgi:hypothetical protein
MESQMILKTQDDFGWILRHDAPPVQPAFKRGERRNCAASHVIGLATVRLVGEPGIAVLLVARDTIKLQAAAVALPLATRPE